MTRASRSARVGEQDLGAADSVAASAGEDSRASCFVLVLRNPLDRFIVHFLTLPVLGGGAIDDRRLATVCDESQLGAMAAGLIDGRQLDERTVFLAGDAQIALGAL